MTSSCSTILPLILLLASFVLLLGLLIARLLLMRKKQAATQYERYTVLFFAVLTVLAILSSGFFWIYTFLYTHPC